MTLPFNTPVPHMLAKAAPAIPAGPEWLYEPKWDGFRCTVFYDGESVFLQSRDLKPLGRYFPELEEALKQTLPGPMVLDGEVVIAGDNGLEFDSLQMRIHPAASRVKMLSEQMPSSFVAFDLLAIGNEDLRNTPFEERRQRLVDTLQKVEAPVYLTPCTDKHDEAQNWFERFEGAGLDGVIAKPRKDAYQPGSGAGSRSSTCEPSTPLSAASAGTAAKRASRLARSFSVCSTVAGTCTT
jgi:ATP-dependent DNA ligase